MILLGVVDEVLPGEEAALGAAFGLGITASACPSSTYATMASQNASRGSDPGGGNGGFRRDLAARRGFWERQLATPL